jgi:selenium-binding protein 1
MSHPRRILALLAILLAPALATAETCMSPFVKRTGKPEKYLYVFCVSLGKHNDSLITIDVEPGAADYGKVIHQLDLGSSANETHHFGYTDDRTHIWGCSLFSSRIFVINVADDPAKPRLARSFDAAEKTGLTGPHSPYAIPGRMLISFLGGKEGGLPAGLAEFENDGSFIRTLKLPDQAPYGYDVAIKPAVNRMVTSSFTPPDNYTKPLAKMDMKRFGDKLTVWDFRARKPLQVLQTGPGPLECRWSLAEGADHGFCNCAFENSLWVWEGQKDGTYTARKLCDTGKLPVDLSESPDGKYLYVSCFASDEIQMWDVSDLRKPKLASTVSPGIQPNMMHVTMDGKRMYITNSLLSTMDRSSEEFWVKLARIGPDGLKMDPAFKVDLMKLPGGSVRGHDMLLNGAR